MAGSRDDRRSRDQSSALSNVPLRGPNNTSSDQLPAAHKHRNVKSSNSLWISRSSKSSGSSNRRSTNVAFELEASNNDRQPDFVQPSVKQEGHHHSPQSSQVTKPPNHVSSEQNWFRKFGLSWGEYPTYAYDKSRGSLSKQTPFPQTGQNKDDSSLRSTEARTGRSLPDSIQRKSPGQSPYQIPRRAVQNVSPSDEKEALVSGPTNETGRLHEDLLQFAHIETLVTKAKLKFPELQGPEDESTEAAIWNILHKYGYMLSQFKDAIERAEECSGLQDQIRRHEEKILGLENDLRYRNTALHQWNHDYRELEKNYCEHTNHLKGQVATLGQEKVEAEASHGRLLRSEQRKHAEAIAILKSTHDNDVCDLKSDCKRLDRTRIQHEADIKHLAKKFNDEANLRVNSERKIQDLERKVHGAKSDQERAISENESRWQKNWNLQLTAHNEEIRKLKEDKKRLRDTMTRERDEKRMEMEKKEGQLREEFEEKSKGLQTVIQDFKTEVTKREHIKGRTDGEISSLFKKLANAIEDFRLDWDPGRQKEWPFADVGLQELRPKNERKLKQHILQNTIWLLLWEHIFCSPFRVFGTLGEENDLHWKEIYGADEWHEIPDDIERKRFQHAKELLDAVESPSNESGLKTQFEQSIADAVTAMTEALERVASLEAREETNLESIVRLAAKTWLDACSQRYRLVVVVSHGSGDLLSSTAPSPSSVKLIIRPELKRYGDSQGNYLMRGELLVGWKGSVESYPQ